MIDNTQEFETKPIPALLWQYALPSVITQIIASVYNIVDRVFLGQCVGALAIAGLAITMPIMNIVHAFGSLVGAGASARMSIVLGRRDIRWAEKILGNSMLLTFIFGALFVSSWYIFADQILSLFGASADTISYAREYMNIVIPGMFLTTLTFNLTGLIRASGYANKSMWIMVCGALINIALDALFIYKLSWGISGAAWATTISMSISSVLAISHFVLPKSFIRFRKHCWSPKLYIFRNILAIGISPFSMNVAASAVAALLNNQLLKYGGDTAVATNGIVNSFAPLIIMLMLGICQGMQPIAGYNYGACKMDRLKSVYKLAMKWNVLIGVVGTFLVLTIPRYLAMAFTNDAALIEQTVPAFRLVLVMCPFIGFTITNSQFFQSIDKPWIAIVTSLSRQVLFLIPMIYIVPPIFENVGWSGLLGVFFSCTICDVMGAALSAILMRSQRTIFQPGYVPEERKPRKECGPKRED
ncbi:MAG: MATE family efflux transporter [Bacteroidales bacterium]|nr:MATE family efflux transporter [Bacteroidales bacterium]